MAAQLGDDALSFVHVEYFINSYQLDSTDAVTSFSKISDFLDRCHDLILDVGKIDQVSNDHPRVSCLSVRGVKYENIKNESCEQASFLSKYLGLNYQESLRVITQMKVKTDDQIPLLSLATFVYQERNAILTTMLLLLNNSNLPVVQSSFAQLVANNVFTICVNLIGVLAKVITQYDKEVPEMPDGLTEREWEEFLQVKKAYNLIYMTNILKLLTHLMVNADLPTHLVEKWFTFLDETRSQLVFMTDVNSSIPGLISHKIESLIVVNTMLVLGLDSRSSAINLDSLYLKDANCFKRIHNILEQDPTNPVILYMWSFVLFTKSFLLEENPDLELSFIQQVFGKVPVSRETAVFAARAEKAGVFGAISRVSESLSSESFYPAIISSFLTFSLNFIPMNVQTSAMIKDVLLRTPQEFVENFLASDEFEKHLTILRAKLPLIDEALLPLVNTSAVHNQFANFEWNELHTYTTKFRLGELDYDIVDDVGESNMDLIILKKEALVKPYLKTNQNALISIPEDTKGKILPTPTKGDEDIIVFLYNYNGWSVLGYILQSICDAYIDNSEGLDDSTHYLLLAVLDLVANAVSKRSSFERAVEILQHLSTYTREKNITSVFFKIFEHSLHKRDYKLLCTCSKFVHSLFAHFPEIVWSHWARSVLLDRSGKTGMANVVLGSIELPIGNYEFTITLIKLTNEMVTEAVSLKADFPLKTKSEMLDKLVIHLIDVYESYQFWKYTNVIQRFELGFFLNSLFTKILYNVYGVDPASSPKVKVTNVLATSGSLILDSFLASQSPDVRAAKSLLNILLSPLNSQISLVGDRAFGHLYLRLMKHAYELAFLLISTRGSLKMPPSTLEKMIFSESSKFVDIYNSVPLLKRHVVKLFKSLVEVPWSDDYLFLLSYLGQRHSKLLLNSISFDLEGPLADHKLAKDIYMFFSALMESKQDGLSILFLTGNIASNKTEERNNLPNHRKSILSVLKKNALHLDALPESVGCCLLDAIAYAFNTWANAKDSKADSEFITALLNHLRNFRPVSTTSMQEMVAMSGKYKLISRVVEIFALYLFTSTDVDSQIFQLLNQQDLATLVNSFFEIDGYNKELHDNLHNKFEEKWPKLKLSSFALSPLFQPGASSNEMVFAIPLMDQFFGNDEKWIGSKDLLGYRDEVIEASLNLQYVSHQIAAAKAWGALLTTFVKKTTQSLKDTFIDLVCHFLKVNIERGIKSPLFTQVYCERLELSFYILYAFQKRAQSIPEKKLLMLLNQLITIFKSDEVNYLGNISYSRNRNFYRPVLRSILILLDAVSTGTHFVELISDELLEFFELSFCKGFHMILSEVLSDISTSTSNGKQVIVYNMAPRIQDLFLLLSLLTKIKALKPLDSFNVILASSLNEVGTVKVILSLYSTSHLLKVNDEALLGPLTLTFVSELCSIKSVAEKFITNGLFAVLLESPLSVAIQKGNIKPENKPSLHNIWTNGLLSIVLLLLSEFGVKVLPECCLFVSYFTKQVDTAIKRWSDSKLAVSSALIKETSQLVLLQKMLSALNYQAYLVNSKTHTAVDEKETYVELLPGLDTEQEKNTLNIALNRLLTHPKYLNSRIVPISLEEARLLEEDHTRAEFVKHISREIKKLQESLFRDI
ncbi:related to Nucleoporin NUP188 [Zygosaccharomyces bailii ISA1307]|uniref:Nucleoporin NUP188 n=1 Tax=Zygosaccharomyces bailii (strain CLIB 213 / ATCC 58445 / CBS 680 / BCRC 21525 / NBRC 1098 / NCYC 1416 / NRRL Y-2227) TaxID=1333698 RepID=A0A8J2T5Y0_ZYGB2|nr:ZYBA0S04-06986g1_1 [Zygosaccharomyces bailii CLIB 213]CDH08518.1 related to Nucleoporin NUP188 [Zygosaccharomyces bailii ISA1307]